MLYLLARVCSGGSGQEAGSGVSEVMELSNGCICCSLRGDLVMVGVRVVEKPFV